MFLGTTCMRMSSANSNVQPHSGVLPVFIGCTHLLLSRETRMGRMCSSECFRFVTYSFRRVSTDWVLLVWIILMFPWYYIHSDMYNRLKILCYIMLMKVAKELTLVVNLRYCHVRNIRSRWLIGEYINQFTKSVVHESLLTHALLANPEIIN